MRNFFSKPSTVPLPEKAYTCIYRYIYISSARTFLVARSDRFLATAASKSTSECERENTARLMIYVTGERERNKREEAGGGGSAAAAAAAILPGPVGYSEGSEEPRVRSVYSRRSCRGIACFSHRNAPKSFQGAAPFFAGAAARARQRRNKKRITPL